mgnify:CR=1 FL=1
MPISKSKMVRSPNSKVKQILSPEKFLCQNQTSHMIANNAIFALASVTRDRRIGSSASVFKLLLIFHQLLY